MKDLIYIEEYLKNKIHNMPEFAISQSVTLDRKIEYWARLSMTDENDYYTDFIQVNGSSLGEVAGKIARHLKSGKHYKDGRYL